MAHALRAASLLLGLAVGATSVLAQQDPLPAATPQAEAADPGADRIGRLEQQIGDLRVMVGALESLLKSKPDAVLPQESAPANAAQNFGAADGELTARVDALETQIGALTSQLQLMTQQLGALESRLTGGAAPQPMVPPPSDADPLPELPGRQGQAPTDPSHAAWADAGGTAFATSITEAPDTSPSEADLVPPPEAQAGSYTPDQPQSLAALAPGLDADSLYKQGYGDLLRRDYPAAETSFRQLVERFPGDPLAGKAQYWLGESYFVRGQFKDAAAAFLKGYETSKTGEKAPDNLLKLAMALAELGQNDAACATLSEFGAKFPLADRHLLNQAKSERRKARC